MDRVTERAAVFAGKLSDAELPHFSYSGLLPGEPCRRAYVTDDSVLTNVVVTNADLFPDIPRGIWNVTREIVSNMILMPELRYKRGAYHVTVRDSGQDVYAMLTHRDPNLKETYDFFRTVGDTLRSMEINTEMLENYQIAQCSALLLPEGPMTAAGTAISDALSGTDTCALREQTIREIKAMTPEDVTEAAEIFDAMSDPQRSGRVTIGGKALIEAAVDEFDSICYRFLGAGTEPEPDAEEIEEMFSEADPD